MRKIICMTVSCLLAMVLLCSTPIAIGMCEVKEAVAMSSVTKPTTREELLVPEDNDFLSRGSTTYNGINGKSVGIYTFYRDCNEPQNNPNFSQTLLIYQCIKYKEKHPEADVSIACSSFHFSVALSACVDDSKPEYGKMKNIYDGEYDDQGYYRLSYLLVKAASLGIDVTVIGQTDAAGVKQNGVVVGDYSFVQYFNSHLSDEAIDGKTVGDFMAFRIADWKSYGDKSAADMMHNKLLTVSHYIDNDGNEHEDAFWTGSINLDGVSDQGLNGNNSIQTAVVLTGHKKIRQIAENYLKIMTDYCDQEQIVPFRDKITKMNSEQIELILAGKENEIPEDEQIVYLGSESDEVFELYFTPLGGGFSTWDIEKNPYAKYIDKLIVGAESGEYIEFSWNNVKYVQSFELSEMMLEGIDYAFSLSKNKNNLLSIHLPESNLDGFFTSLVQGENIGYKGLNVYVNQWWYHTKDFQLSYVENGQRQYVTVFNSLNIHEGSMYHQTNTIFVVKESAKTGNDVYVNYAQLLNPHINFLSRRISK